VTGQPRTPPHIDLTLVVETPTRAMVRRVPAASPLRAAQERGPAAEEATSDAASEWGLPDFVFRAELQQTASGVREVGDRLLVVGQVGVVVQVKCRSAPTADAARERRWIERNIRKAVAQAKGSIRFLQSHRVPATNVRGRIADIGCDERRWLAAVVIDHADPPDVTPALDNGDGVMVLLRRDWEFLFDQLKSTQAVVGYFARVAGEAVPLGDEPLRYYDLARADAEAAPGKIDPALVGQGGSMASAPMLPFAPAETHDMMAHRVIRIVLEDIAVSRVGDVSEADRLRILALVDGLPVGHRAQAGRFMLDSLGEVANAASGETAWRLRRLVPPDGMIQLAFGACSKYSDITQTAFGAWVRLRHHEQRQRIPRSEDLTTIGVILTPRNDGIRPWDTTMAAVSGDPQLTCDDIERLSELFGARD
jgi:hypothetical protein